MTEKNAMTIDSIDRDGCLGTSIKVAAGRYVDLNNPDPATIDIETIAASLSKLCRFGGHCPRFYSVAEHCVHATALAASCGITGDALMAVFLHDAAESYVGDMVKPLKLMMPDFSIVESRIESAIESKFGISFAKHSETIKRFDLMMLKAEKLSMWPDDKTEWHGFAAIEDHQLSIQYWMPSDAERWFNSMASMLKLK